MLNGMRPINEKEDCVFFVIKDAQWMENAFFSLFAYGFMI